MDGQHAVPRLHQAVFEQHPQRDAPPGQQGAPAGAGPQVCLLSSAQLLLILLASILHHLWRAGWLWAWVAYGNGLQMIHIILEYYGIFT